MKNLTTINEQNFNEVYNEFYSNLFRFVNNKVHDEDYSNAIVNDSFMNAYNSMNEFKPSLSTLSTWLHNIAKNKMIDHFRTTQTQKRNMAEMDVSVVEFAVSGEFSDGEHVMINKQMGLSIEKAFDRVKNEKYREIGKNFLVDGFSLKELSENYNMPMNTVKTIVKRVRETLQSQLQTVRA